MTPSNDNGQREALTETELDALAEKLLDKLLTALARRQKAENDVAQQPRPKPPPEVYAAVIARRRRKGR